MLGIDVLEKAYQDGYTGSIGAFDHIAFWDNGQILSVTTSDDLAWTALRLCNRGFLSPEFSQSLSLEQPLSFRCFPQVPAVAIRQAILDRMHHNIFVFSMLESSTWAYSSHTARLKILRELKVSELLTTVRRQGKALGTLYWQASKLWVRFMRDLPEWVGHPTATQPIRQLILDAPFEELELLGQLHQWEQKGLIQISDSPAHISTELTEEDRLIFKDHDRYRGPKSSVPVVNVAPNEDEEIALDEGLSSDTALCIHEANEILGRISHIEGWMHPMLLKQVEGYCLQLPPKQQNAEDIESITEAIAILFRDIGQKNQKAIAAPDQLRWESRWLG